MADLGEIFLAGMQQGSAMVSRARQQRLQKAKFEFDRERVKLADKRAAGKAVLEQDIFNLDKRSKELDLQEQEFEFKQSERQDLGRRTQLGLQSALQPGGEGGR